MADQKRISKVLSTLQTMPLSNSRTVVCCNWELLFDAMWMSDKKIILASCSGWWIDKAYQMCKIFGDNKTLKQLRLQGLSNGFPMASIAVSYGHSHDDVESLASGDTDPVSSEMLSSVALQKLLGST